MTSYVSTYPLKHAIVMMYDYHIIGSTVTPDPIGYRVFKYRDKHVKLKLWDMPGSCSCFNVVNERYNIILLV